MPDSAVFPMQPVWKFTFLLVPALGLVAIVLPGAELLGLVERGQWLGEAGDGERWAAVVFGALLLPFGTSALRHARVKIDATHFRYLGFGFVCSTRAIAFADVRRWGHAVGRNQGRREAMLLFELQDGSERLVKLAMYARQAELKQAIADRLGPAAPASATFTGVAFDE